MPMITQKYAVILRIPDAVVSVLELLQNQGAEAWVTGGAVRDALLGKSTYDTDVATSMPYEKFASVFPPEWIRVTLPHYGCIKIKVDGVGIDVTVFRKEGMYTDHRHPKHIEPTVRAVDALRRDLTMNALYYDPISGVLVDDVGGMCDLLQRGAVRLVRGKDSLAEDYLRILRVVRFALQCGLEIDPETFACVREAAPAIAHIHPDRIREETQKCLKSASLQDVLSLWQRTRLLPVVMGLLPSHSVLLPTAWHGVLKTFAPGTCEIQDLVFILGLLNASAVTTEERTEVLQPVWRFFPLSKKQRRQIKKAYRYLSDPTLSISNFRPSPLMQAILRVAA